MIRELLIVAARGCGPRSAQGRNGKIKDTTMGVLVDMRDYAETIKSAKSTHPGATLYCSSILLATII